MKYTILLVSMLAGCPIQSTNHSTNSEKQDLIVDNRGLVTIDVTKKYPEKMLYIQNFADVEYIPLETNDKSLIRGGRPDIISEKYIVYHNQDGQVLVFNRQGKLLHSFNRIGESPEEYNTIFHIVLDKKKEELYIETNGDLSTPVCVYSIDGKFKRKFILPGKYTLQHRLDYDEDHLLCYNTFYIDTSKKIQEKNECGRDQKQSYINLIGTGLLHNTSYCLIYPDYLLQAHSANKLKGELKEIASKLKEDDNPVLMLIKFKE